MLLLATISFFLTNCQARQKLGVNNCFFGLEIIMDEKSLQAVMARKNALGAIIFQDKLDRQRLLVSLFDPRGRPQPRRVVITIYTYVSTSFCPSVPKHQNQAKITAGRDRGLAEWIIDDSCLFFPLLSLQYC